MDQALIDLIHATIGAKRNYTLMDVYTVLSALVDLMSDECVTRERKSPNVR